MTAQSPDLAAVVEHASDMLFSWTALLFALACPQGCPFSLYARICRPHESMQHIHAASRVFISALPALRTRLAPLVFCTPLIGLEELTR